MTLWFLRLFSAYRNLEAELAQAASRAIEADDRVRLAKSHLEMVRDEKGLLASKLEWTIKQTANHEARRNGSSHVPFPDVEVVQPPEPDPAPDAGIYAPSHRRSLREIQQEAVMKSRAAAADRRAAMANGTESE